jgi:hypothetical protein
VCSIGLTSCKAERVIFSSGGEGEGPLANNRGPHPQPTTTRGERISPLQPGQIHPNLAHLKTQHPLAPGLPPWHPGLMGAGCDVAAERRGTPARADFPVPLGITGTMFQYGQGGGQSQPPFQAIPGYHDPPPANSGK